MIAVCFLLGRTEQHILSPGHKFQEVCFFMYRDTGLVSRFGMFNIVTCHRLRGNSFEVVKSDLFGIFWSISRFAFRYIAELDFCICL